MARVSVSATRAPIRMTAILSRLVVESASERVVLEIPATEREVSVRGFNIPVDMIGTVRLYSTGEQGVVAVVDWLKERKA